MVNTLVRPVTAGEMRLCRPLLAILCVLASLLVPRMASASKAAGPETRVRGFDPQEQVRIEREAALTLELHQGCCELAYDDLASDSLLAARGAARQITINSAHGARHLEGTGLASEAVESAITRHIEAATKAASETGSFWGRVTVEGQVIEYRTFTLPNSTINVGTYYPPVP